MVRSRLPREQPGDGRHARDHGEEAGRRHPISTEELEHFPKSAPTYAALAQAKIAKGDTQEELDPETAATLDPQSRPIREQLQRIKGQ